MAIRYRCPRCSQLLSIATRMAGQAVTCPTCGTETTVPGASTEPESQKAVPESPFEEPPQEEVAPEVPVSERPAPQASAKMSVLEIRHRTGRIETRELSKMVPLLVGQNPASDIRIEADGVAPMHCRIRWNGSDYEIVATTPAGVQYNGATVQRAVIIPGSILRIGDVDIVLANETRGGSRKKKTEGAEKPAERGKSPAGKHSPASGYELSEALPAGDELLPGDSLLLKAITEDELPVRSFNYSDKLSGDKPSPVADSKKTDDKPTAESAAGMRSHGLDRIINVPLDLEDLAKHEEFVASPPEEREQREQREQRRDVSVSDRLQQTLGVRPVRPGEQELLRSPLVLGTGIGAIALLLAAATIWFVLSREAAQRMFDAAESQRQSGLFAQAVEGYEQFLKQYPRHKLADQARIGAASARVDQSLAGAAPAWDRALEALDKFLKDYRDTPEFQPEDSELRKYLLQSADRIAIGAAEAAKTQRKRPLLQVSADAVKLIEVYCPREAPPKERLAEIAAAARAGEAAVLQQESLDSAVKQMETELEEGRALAALDTYRKALARYPDGANYAPLKKQVKSALDADNASIAREEVGREAAAGDDRGAAPRPLILARRTRARTDLPSVGNAVWAVAEDVCFGIDTVTGEPLWRRVVGAGNPFFPLTVSASEPALLVFDGVRRELCLLKLRTGDAIWRLGLDDVPTGSPLVHEGQIFVATAGGRLCQVDLLTGRLSNQLKFSQKVIGPPAVSNSGERMYLPGNESVLYILTRRPLGIEQTIRLGHGPGAIAAPPVMLHKYLLLAENDRLQSALLRLFDTGDETRPPAQISSLRIDGTVREPPALRGKQLFVPSWPERVTAVTVSETGDRKALALVAAYQVKNGKGGPVYLTAGPDDQVWMTSTALRRLELTRDSLLPGKQESAVGLSAQPLQMIGESIYIGRRLPFSLGVVFSEIDRRPMSLQWQISLGAGVAGTTAPDSKDGTVIVVTALGDVYQITPSKLSRGGYDTQGLAPLPVPEGTMGELAASRLVDGRLAVRSAGDEPRLWIIGIDGSVQLEYKLPAALQADPILVANGLLLPLPGKLRLVSRSFQEPLAEDYLMPVTPQDPPVWRTLVSLDDRQVAALDSSGRIARFQYRTNPASHLYEVAHWEAKQPADLGLSAAAGRIAVTDAQGQLTLLDASSLEPLGQVQLDPHPSRMPAIVGTQVVVAAGTDKLVCLDGDRSLEKRWEIPLKGALPVGAPLTWNGRWIVPFENGEVLLLDPQSGEVVRKFNLGQSLSFGAQQWGENIVVGGRDGSLIVLNSLLPSEGATTEAKSDSQ